MRLIGRYLCGADLLSVVATQYPVGIGNAGYQLSQRAGCQRPAYRTLRHLPAELAGVRTADAPAHAGGVGRDEGKVLVFAGKPTTPTPGFYG